MSHLPHPDDTAARRALATDPPVPLVQILAQAAASEASRTPAAHVAWIRIHRRLRDPETLPLTPRCVLATDGEIQYIAVHELGQWLDAHSEDPLDNPITHWAELPPLPAED